MNRRELMIVGLVSPVLAAVPYSRRYAFAADSDSPWDGEIRIERADDLVDLKVQWVGFEPRRARRAPGYALRSNDSGQRLIAFTFPPQHMSEEIIQLGERIPDSFRANFSHESKLVFEIPPGIDQIELNFASLLDWSGWSAKLPHLDSARAPTQFDSYIELPYRVFVSAPNKSSKWKHPIDIEVDWRSGYEQVKRRELWMTRLASSSDQFVPFWTPDLGDYRGPAADDVSQGGYESPISPVDRVDIVKTFSDRSFDCGGREALGPLPTAEVLGLSTLGGWVRGGADWDPPIGCSLKSFEINASHGRTNFLKVQRVGWLYPFGFEAVYVRETARQIDRNDDGATLRAPLVQKHYVQILPPQTIPYSPEVFDQEMPFNPLRSLTVESPPLDVVRYSDIGLTRPSNNLCKNQEQDFLCDGASASEDFVDAVHGSVFWPTVDNMPFEFTLEGTDHAGDLHVFTSPMIFVVNEASLLKRDGTLRTEVEDTIKRAWRSFPSRGTISSSFSGQRIALARPRDPGDTSVDVQRIEFEKNPQTLWNDVGSIARVPFVARVHKVKGTTPAYRGLVGDKSFLSLSYQLYPDDATDTRVLDPDSSDNRIGAYLSTFESDGPFSLDFGQGQSSARAGAISKPNTTIVGLSRTQGLVGGAPTNGLVSMRAGDTGGLEDAVAGVQKTGAFFSDTSRLLGGPALNKLFGAQDETSPRPKLEYFYGSPDAANAPPTLQSPIPPIAEWPSPVGNLSASARTLPSVGNLVPGLSDYWISYPATSLRVAYDWETSALTSFAQFKRQNDTKLRLSGSIEYDLLTGESRSKSDGRLNDFWIYLPKADGFWIGVDFQHVTFSSSTGTSTKFNPVVRDVDFGGPLKFVSTFKSLLEGLGQRGFEIDVHSSFISITHGFEVEPIQLGAFSIENIEFRYGVAVPLTGEALALDFRFSERDDPFVMTAGAYSGGGYFGTLLDADGPRTLEIALEFGGSVGLNFSIASGLARIMAGLYYKLNRESGSSLLEGYVRTSGQFSIIGIGSLSLVIYVAMGFREPGSAYGYVTVTVKAKFGIVEVKRTFPATHFVSNDTAVHRLHSIEGRGGLSRAFDEDWNASAWSDYQSAFA